MQAGKVMVVMHPQGLGARPRKQPQSGSGQLGHVISNTNSGVARGLLQGRLLQLLMGWGVAEEMTKS